jgi:hypothetical protein
MIRLYRGRSDKAGKRIEIEGNDDDDGDEGDNHFSGYTSLIIEHRFDAVRIWILISHF